MAEYIQSEHYYLQNCVNDRYWLERGSLRETYSEKINQALHSRDWILADRLEQEESLAEGKLIAQKQRSEDIICWLRLDTALRQEGKTYPDVYERVAHEWCDTAQLFPTLHP
jgi:hypothetical protein